MCLPALACAGHETRSQKLQNLFSRNSRILVHSKSSGISSGNWWTLLSCVVLLHSHGPLREMSKTIFAGCVFCTVGTLSRSTLDVTKAVRENGGTVSYLITKKVLDFLLLHLLSLSSI